MYRWSLCACCVCVYLVSLSLSLCIGGLSLLAARSSPLCLLQMQKSHVRPFLKGSCSLGRSFSRMTCVVQVAAQFLDSLCLLQSACEAVAETCVFMCQYLYFCTGKASKLHVPGAKHVGFSRCVFAFAFAGLTCRCCCSSRVPRAEACV